MNRKRAVGIVGATGIAGQQFVVALQHHPWFAIERLAVSERSSGKSFGPARLEAKTAARRWWRSTSLPRATGERIGGTRNVTMD